jgi:predicted anti-sigma-YlaC factor YlaD
LLRAQKPVEIRCGRATVIGSLAESQTCSRGQAHLAWGREFPEEYWLMNTTTHLAPAAGITAIPLREALPWVIFAGLLMLLGVYFVGAEEGATSIIKGMYVHEFVHDSRHLLGFPCH